MNGHPNDFKSGSNKGLLIIGALFTFFSIAAYLGYEDVENQLTKPEVVKNDKSSEAHKSSN